MIVAGEVRDMLCAHDYKIEFTRKPGFVHESTQKEDPNESDPLLGKRGKDSVSIALKHALRTGSIALERGSESTFQDKSQTNTGFCDEGEVGDQPIDSSSSTKNVPNHSMSREMSRRATSIMVAPSRSNVSTNVDTF